MTETSDTLSQSQPTREHRSVNTSFSSSQSHGLSTNRVAACYGSHADSTLESLVVDLAKDPSASGFLARSTTPEHSRKRRFTLSAAFIVVACIVFASASPANAQEAPQKNDANFRSAMATAVRNAAQQVLPSVVSIEVVGVAQTTGGRNESSEVSQDAPSCGVVIDPQGYLIASDMVVRRPSASILVVLPDGNRLAAKVVARDHHRGLVVLRVKPKQPLVAAELPGEIDLPVGSTVVGVGRYGVDGAPIVTTGILSAKGRLEGTMLQFDARVSPAFYGGPLVDLYGRLIGIQIPAVAKGGAPDDTSWYDSGVAFAVPAVVISAKLERLIDGQDIKKGLIGIVPKSSDPLADGTELAAVRSRSPAEKAGIKSGDTIKSINGTPVKMFQQIKEALGPLDAGETISIELQRGKETKTVSVTLADSIPPLRPQRLGIWADEVESEDGTTEVVVRGVVPGTAASDILQTDDVIKLVGQTTVTDVSTLRRTMITAVPDEAIAVKVIRGGDSKELTLTPTAISGPSLDETIDAWKDQKPTTKWTVQKLRLPDVTNAAAYVAPPIGEDSDEEQSVFPDGIGMLALLLPPDKRDPEKMLESYRDVAGRYGVVVCAISSEDDKRWQPKEIDVVSRLVTMLSQRVEVSPSAVAIASPGVIKDVPASAADSMVVAIALSDRKNFSGIAVGADAKPPAVRLRENEPDRSLEILLPIESVEDGPTWMAPLMGAGYPFALGGEVEIADLLRWTRLLQTL